MSRFSGRRPTGLGKALLNGLGELAVALADAPKLARIKEIDAQVEELLQERDHVIKSLTESIPGYEVSENYDPRWAKTSTASGEGRLTECRGSFSAGNPFNDAHPGCPYKDEAHRRHEFTLND